MKLEKIVISDTNIFIDLISSDMLEEFFSLPMEIHTTDFVIREITASEQKARLLPYPKAEKLHVIEFDYSELAAISEFMTNCRTNASFTDCSVWYASKKLGCRLLTGDAKLRTAVEKDNVLVSGILFIFDSAVEYCTIEKQKAAVKLRKLLQTNVRLPVRECEMRITKWQSADGVDP